MNFRCIKTRKVNLLQRRTISKGMTKIIKGDRTANLNRSDSVPQAMPWVFICRSPGIELAATLEIILVRLNYERSRENAPLDTIVGIELL